MSEWDGTLLKGFAESTGYPTDDESLTRLMDRFLAVALAPLPRESTTDREDEAADE